MTNTKSVDRLGEEKLRGMYEFAPYPDLGADLKDLSLYLNPIRSQLKSKPEVRFLEVGCGTGHYVVGVAKKYPHWKCQGMDLSQASLDIAVQLAEAHGTDVSFNRGSYLDPLPFKSKFDVICAMGTIHHTVDPESALKNIRKHIKDDGYLLLHLYGQRCDQEKFDIKDALSILEPDLGNYEKRFYFYQTLMEHKKRNWLKRIALTTPESLYVKLLSLRKNINRRMKKVSWSPPWNASHTEITPSWIDHFCNPCERAYDVPGVQALLEESGFKIVHMLKQGREHMKLFPAEWRPAYEKLNDWEKWRLNEFLATGGTSFAMVVQPRLKKEK